MNDYYQENPVFALFEGVCPDHVDKEVTITQVGGTPNFFKFNPEYNQYNPNVWSDEDLGDLTDANITFTCPEGCTFVVAHNVYGDWNL